MQTVLENAYVRLLLGEAREVLSTIPERSVHCAFTSPPYWALRTYQGEQEMSWADGSRAALGHEATPEAYITHLLEVCSGVWRVLRDDGVFFLNMDDSRAGSGGPGGDYRDGRRGGDEYLRRYESGKVGRGKDMILVPERLAVALQEQGWYIRSKIVWAKTPMPESAADRPVDSWEIIFMLTKASSYYWDDEAVRVASEPGTPVRGRREHENSKFVDTKTYGISAHVHGLHTTRGPSRAGHRVWNVLHIPQEPLPSFYKDGKRLDHHAAFPPGLPAWGIRATTSEIGCCPACGAQWKRVYDDHPMRTVGWESGCQCEARAPIPPTVLDPFVGSGSTCIAAFELGRRSVGVDLDDGYLEIARQRLATAQWPSVRMGLEPRLRARLDVQLGMPIE